jgi:hypothetical protein
LAFKAQPRQSQKHFTNNPLHPQCLKAFGQLFTRDMKVNKKLIGYKIITWKFCIGISAGTKMAKGT